MTYTIEQITYIQRHGGQMVHIADVENYIYISAKDYNKIPHDYTGQSFWNKNVHVWQIPGPMLLTEGPHFMIVK